MNLNQLLDNIADIKSVAAPPYYVGKSLVKQLQNACVSSRSTITTVDAVPVETCIFDGIPQLEGVPFILMDYKNEKDPTTGKLIPHELDLFFGNLSAEKVLNEIKVE